GQFRALSISAACVIWGLVSALTLAFYTLYPVGLVERFGAPAVVGWAMIIGAVPPVLGGAARHLPELPAGEWAVAWGLTAFVVLFGTLVAFSFYLASLRYLSPAETSLLACAEPLSAVAATAMLGVHLGLAGAAGAACILAAVVLIAAKRGSPAGERDG
ncbi:MAG: EamA family transporter, partial [Alicyclobacillaceae bacterium]|nr:EamA family transporter [Alicyclobacillaceae bacterium]